MIDEIINSFLLRIRDIYDLVEDLNEEQMVSQPVEGMNHPTWNIGHIIYSFQAIGEEMGMDHWLSEQWVELFKQGSKLANNPQIYPKKRELLEALEKGKDRILHQLKEMDEAKLAGPLPDIRYRSIFSTLGYAVLNTLTSHIAIHTGYITAWRSAMKLPKLRNKGL